MNPHDLVRRGLSGLGALAMSLACGYVFVAAPLHAQSDRAPAEVRDTWTSTRLRDTQAPRAKEPIRAETADATGRS